MLRLFKRPFVSISFCLLLVGTGAGAYYEFIVPHDPIPQNIRSQVHFALYYPDTLPSGWTLENSSFFADPSDHVVGYSLKGPDGNLNITIQSIPKDFDFNDFYTKRLTNTVQFLTPLGQGAIGNSGYQTVGSLVTISSWVLASPSSSKVTQADIQFILNHLRAGAS